MAVPRDNTSTAGWRKDVERQLKLLRRKLDAATFLSSTEPADAARASTWINPDEGNAQYYFDGTTWVPVRDETIAVAQGTANQAAIDAAAAEVAAAAAAAAAAALELDLDAAEAAIDAAEASIATLNDTTLPALQSALDAAEADVAAAQADLTTLTGTTLPALQTEVDGILPITETDITDDAITTPKLAAGAVTALKIAANTITAAQIAADAITASELAADAVVAGKIAAGTIVAADIAAGAVTTAKLAAGAVTANEIAAGAVTADKVSAAYVYAGQIAVDQLQGGSLTADVVLASTISTRVGGSGAGLDVGPFGLVTYAADNTPQTVLPSDAGGVNSFKGTIEASGATFTGGVSFRGVTEVAPGGVITLASGVTTPQQAPSAVVDWETVPISGSTGHGIGWVWKDSKWWTLSATSGSGSIFSFDPVTGAAGSTVALSDGGTTYAPGGGLAWNGTYWYTVGRSAADGQWYVLRWDAAGNLQNGSVYTPLSAGGWYYEAYTIGSMQIAYRASTGQLAVVEHDSAGQRFRVQYRDATTCATLSTTNTSVQAGFTAPPGGVAFGNFDYGAERLVVASRNSGSVWVFPTSTYTYSTTDSFPAASGMLTGLGWDGTSFSTARIFPDGLSMTHKYTGIGKAWTPTAAESTGWPRFTWNNASPAYTTTPSPAAQFTMKKRARFTLTTPDLPTGADTVKTYLSFGATEPANSSRWLQGTDGRSQTFTTLTTSGSNPPTVGTFPSAGTPGKLQSSDGAALVLTATSAVLPATTVVSLATTATWVAPALTNSWVNLGGSSPVTQYRRMPDGDVQLRGVLSNAVVAAGTNLPMFTLPAGFRPPVAVGWAVPISGGFARLLVGTDGGVYHTVAAGSKTFIEITGRFSTLT